MNRKILLSLLAIVALPVAAETVNFDKHPVGAAPADWTCAGHGNPRGGDRSVWKVEADAKAPSAPNVLLQSGSTAYAYCLKNGASLADGVVEVRFKPIFGENAQAGGVVFRFKDQENYYVARANANESNLNLYYFEKGQRKSAKEIDTPTIALNEWHTLKVDFKGKKIVVVLDGKTLIDVEDDHIAGAGGIGVWTRFDSKTAFDDFTY